MAKVMNVVNALDANGKEFNVFVKDLFTINNDLLIDIDEVKELQNLLIALINSRLNQSDTRSDGLDILSCILSQVPKEILTKHAVLWITKAIQILENVNSNLHEIGSACKALGELITRCKEIPELQKHVSMQTVKQLIIAVSNLSSDKKCCSTLYLIGMVLYHYKEPAERLQTTIRKIILPVIDSEQKSLVQAGANCYTLLARATERSYKPPPTQPTYTGWVAYEVLLCDSLNSIMDILFTGLVEMDCPNTSETLELPKIQDDNRMQYYHNLERRFANLCIFLSTMLRGCNGKNSVSPHNILQVVCRGLAVAPVNFRNQDTFVKEMLYFIMPKIHMSLLTILNMFIDGFKQELVKYAVTILKLYTQTLEWTDKIGENQTTISGSKPFKKVRVAVYKSLRIWLACLGTMSAIETVDNELLKYILKDITPEKERVLLTVQKPQHASKRAMKKFKDNQYENSTNLGSANVVAKDSNINAELCTEALITLQNMFVNASRSMEQSFYKGIERVIIPLLYDYYQGKLEQNFYEKSSECRLQLLRTLKAIQLYPHPLKPPLTEDSLEIFGMALNDTDLNIIEEAKLAIAILEKISHPSAPTLRMPVRDASDQREDRGLAIHWNRLETEVQIPCENEVAQPVSNIWERMKEKPMDESAVADQGQDGNTRLEESSKSESDSTVANVENVDGPTPSKQQKLADPAPSERMDTSEDELITPSPEDESNLINKINSPAYVSPIKKRVERNEIEINDANSGDEEIAQTQSESTYFTLKEIHGNVENFQNIRDAKETTTSNGNDGVSANDSLTNASSGNDSEVSESKQELQVTCDDESDDEDVLSLFRDKLKDD